MIKQQHNNNNNSIQNSPHHAQLGVWQLTVYGNNKDKFIMRVSSRQQRKMTHLGIGLFLQPPFLFYTSGLFLLALQLLFILSIHIINNVLCMINDKHFKVYGKYCIKNDNIVIYYKQCTFHGKFNLDRNKYCEGVATCLFSLSSFIFFSLTLDCLQCSCV